MISKINSQICIEHNNQKMSQQNMMCCLIWVIQKSLTRLPNTYLDTDEELNSDDGPNCSSQIFILIYPYTRCFHWRIMLRKVKLRKKVTFYF